MNLANRLTLLRTALVPVFVLFIMANFIPNNYLWALLVFIAASITDMADGKIARSRNMVTDFGKFLDPLADKMLVAAALVCMVELGWTYAWVTIIVIVREFAVSGVRLAAASSEKKKVISAGILGKIKTAFTMVSICVILFLHIVGDYGLFPENFPVQPISDILMYISAGLTLVSGVQYIYDYREYLDTEK